jgi:putative effector of murein hydrolase
MAGSIWFLIHSHPLFGLVVTILVYALANQIYKISGQCAVLYPVLTTVCAVAAIVSATGMSYENYLAQAAPLHHGLSLVVVLLAVPLLRQLPRLRSVGVPIALALTVGSVTAMTTALAPAILLQVGQVMSASLVPKSATAAVAVGIADRLGGMAGLTAVVVITTGIAGAVFGPSCQSALNLDPLSARNFDPLYLHGTAASTRLERSWSGLRSVRRVRVAGLRLCS